MTLADMPTGENPKLNETELTLLAAELDGWQLLQDEIPKLEKQFAFQNFADALEFVNAIGAIAEEVGHHPKICLTWGSASVLWWSHSIGGLTLNDFVMAARTDRTPH